MTSSSLVVLISVLFRSFAGDAAMEEQQKQVPLAKWQVCSCAVQMLKVSNVMAHLSRGLHYESTQLSFANPSPRFVGVVDDHNTYSYSIPQKAKQQYSYRFGLCRWIKGRIRDQLQILPSGEGRFDVLCLVLSIKWSHHGKRHAAILFS